MKSEYFAPPYAKGERPQPQILIDAQNILSLLIRAEAMMTKVDRIRYLNRAIIEVMEVIAQGSLAYDFEEDRYYHIKALTAHIAVLLRLLRIIGERNCICIRTPHDELSPEPLKLQLMESMAKMDEGATRWRKSIQKAYKEQGHDRHPCDDSAVSNIIKDTLPPSLGG